MNFDKFKELNSIDYCGVNLTELLLEPYLHRENYGILKKGKIYFKALVFYILSNLRRNKFAESEYNLESNTQINYIFLFWIQAFIS